MAATGLTCSFPRHYYPVKSGNPERVTMNSPARAKSDPNPESRGRAKTSDYLLEPLSESGFVIDLARNGIDGLHMATPILRTRSRVLLDDER